jgi:hypothetical protein
MATRVQVRTVAQRLVRVRIDDLLEVDILARRLIRFQPHRRYARLFRPVLAELAVVVVVLLELWSHESTITMTSAGFVVSLMATLIMLLISLLKAVGSDMTD